MLLMIRRYAVVPCIKPGGLVSYAVLEALMTVYLHSKKGINVY